MTIPCDVVYSTVGGKKTRHVIGVICPTVFNQTLSAFKKPPIYVNMGDIEVDWTATSPGMECLLRGGL